MNERHEMVLLAIVDKQANSRGWIRVNCPFCVVVRGDEDRRVSFGVSATTGRFECYKCGTKGRLPKKLIHGDLDMLVDLDPPDQPPPRPETIDPPDGFTLLGSEPGLSAWSTREARQYLERRHCGLEIIRTMSVGVVVEGRVQREDGTSYGIKHRVVFPVILDGQNLGWVARSYRPSQLKYLYPPGMNRAALFYNELAIDKVTDEPLLVVEGIFDCFPHWPNVAACLGKPTDPQIDRLAQAKRPVVMLLDGDAWIESRAVAWQLQHAGVQAGWLHLPPGSDPAELEPGVTRELARAVIEEGHGRHGQEVDLG